MKNINNINKRVEKAIRYLRKRKKYDYWKKYKRIMLSDLENGKDKEIFDVHAVTYGFVTAVIRRFKKSFEIDEFICIIKRL